MFGDFFGGNDLARRANGEVGGHSFVFLDTLVFYWVRWGCQGGSLKNWENCGQFKDLLRMCYNVGLFLVREAMERQSWRDRLHTHPRELKWGGWCALVVVMLALAACGEVEPAASCSVYQSNDDGIATLTVGEVQAALTRTATEAFAAKFLISDINGADAIVDGWRTVHPDEGPTVVGSVVIKAVWGQSEDGTQRTAGGSALVFSPLSAGEAPSGDSLSLVYNPPTMWREGEVQVATSNRGQYCYFGGQPFDHNSQYLGVSAGGHEFRVVPLVEGDVVRFWQVVPMPHGQAGR